jgi:hypothetical protein
MAASIMMAPVGSMPKVRGSRIDRPAAGPKPGMMPMIMPIIAPAIR